MQERPSTRLLFSIPELIADTLEKGKRIERRVAITSPQGWRAR
jgi:hypothetical protein